jgi:hypothetical protein
MPPSTATPARIDRAIRAVSLRPSRPVESGATGDKVGEAHARGTSELTRWRLVLHDEVDDSAILVLQLRPRTRQPFRVRQLSDSRQLPGLWAQAGLPAGHHALVGTPRHGLGMEGRPLGRGCITTVVGCG